MVTLVLVARALAGCAAVTPDEESPLTETAAAAHRRAPSLIETEGPFGTISVFPDAIFGDFFASGTILRDPNVSECVARIRSVTEPRASAGVMTARSSFLAETGGGSDTVVVEQDFTGEYVFFAPPFVYPTDRSVPVTITTTGSREIPALPPTTLRSSPFPFLEIKKPEVPPSGTLVVQSDRDFVVKWKRPQVGRGRNGQQADETRVVLSLWFLAGFTLDGEVRCGFPLSANKGAIPQSLLGALKQRIPENALGILNVFVGDQREVRPDGASIVIELGPFDSSTLGQQFVEFD